MGDWLPAAERETFLRNGFYKVQLPQTPNLKIISLNMQFCYLFNFWRYYWYLLADPAGMMQWLIGELQQSEEAGEKVFVIGHVPPGHGDCMSQWSRYFYEIVRRYASTISAQFFGHVHLDSFQIFYQDEEMESRPCSVAFITPSVTPHVNLNPAFRIVEAAARSWRILDVATYMADIEEANSAAGAEPSWTLEYSVRELFRLKSCDASEMNALVSRLQSDGDLFGVFWSLMHRRSKWTPLCGEECKRQVICSLKSGSYAVGCPKGKKLALFGGGPSQMALKEQ
jgi:sphingomyelin phosphodiesterase